MNQQYLIFPWNKRKIKSLCFQKPHDQKLTVNATYKAVCFSITRVPLACVVVYFSFENISFGFHRIVNLCKHGKLLQLVQFKLKKRL